MAGGEPLDQLPRAAVAVGVPADHHDRPPAGPVGERLRGRLGGHDVDLLGAVDVRPEAPRDPALGDRVAGLELDHQRARRGRRSEPSTWTARRGGRVAQIGVGAVGAGRAEVQAASAAVRAAASSSAGQRRAGRRRCADDLRGDLLDQRLVHLGADAEQVGAGREGAYRGRARCRPRPRRRPSSPARR